MTRSANALLWNMEGTPRCAVRIPISIIPKMAVSCVNAPNTRARPNMAEVKDATLPFFCCFQVPRAASKSTIAIAIRNISGAKYEKVNRLGNKLSIQQMVAHGAFGFKMLRYAL